MGQSAHHVPVLLREVGDALATALPEADAPPWGIYVDATTGLGGHAEAVLQRFRPAKAFLLDRDAAALEHSRTRLTGLPCELHFVGAPFSRLREVLAAQGVTAVSAIVADLGVSSMQLDSPERGFSLRADGPLDMRMDPSQGETAAELIARLDVPDLTRILREFGEEPDAQRIAREIAKRRPQTTLELAQVVTDAMSARQRRAIGTRIHPATRTFQALRIEVNGELRELDRFLQDAPTLLVVGGRLAIISFHSLEDRRVKRRFRELSTAPQPPSSVPVTADALPPAPFRIPDDYRRGATASEQETRANPRARSARLRVLERVIAELP